MTAYEYLMNYGMDKERVQCLLCDSLRWVKEVSDQAFKDMVDAIGIVDDELEFLGFKEEGDE